MPLHHKQAARSRRYPANRRPGNRRASLLNRAPRQPRATAASVWPVETIVGGSLEISLPELAVAGTTLTIDCSCSLPGGPALVWGTDTPCWNSTMMRLDFRGVAAKRLRRDACNMQAVVDAFQRAAWPEWIADPLPRGEVDVRDRLYNTIKRLNRHFGGMIRFSCDGHSTGIFWQAAARLGAAAAQSAPLCGKKRPSRTRRASQKCPNQNRKAPQ